MLSELFSLLSFLAAFLVSLKYYNIFSGILESKASLSHNFANALGFILIWYLIEIGLFFLARWLLGPVTRIKIFPGERFLSMIPALMRGMIFIAIMLVLIAAFPVQPKFKKEVNSSLVASYILARTYQLEAPLKTIFGGLADDTLAFLTVHPRSNENVSLGFKTTSFNYPDQTEQQMILLVNRERTSRGLKALSFEASLRDIARAHSSDMLRRGYFSHQTPEGQDVAGRAVQRGVDYQIIGENLAFAPNLDLSHSGLMNSPGHRANILNPAYHKVGIGIANTPDYGLMVTQVFTD